MHKLARCTRCALKVLKQTTKFARAITTTPFPEFADVEGVKSHQDLHQFSLDHPDEFWGRLARSRLKWDKDFDTVSDCDLEKGRISWFQGGKLNASGKCCQFINQNTDNSEIHVQDFLRSV